MPEQLERGSNALTLKTMQGGNGRLHSAQQDIDAGGFEGLPGWVSLLIEDEAGS